MTTDTDRLNFLASWVQGDVVICPPGFHGGPANDWLVALGDESRRDFHGRCGHEYFASSLREAIDTAQHFTLLDKPHGLTPSPSVVSPMDETRT